MNIRGLWVPPSRPGREECAVMTTTTTSFPDIPLPATVRSRYIVENVNGLRMHVLECGFETRGRPCVLLLHGFPELAYSWRKVMPALAEAGYHVVAPDQRGYGRTTGWDDELRRRPTCVPAAKFGARRARAGVGVRLTPVSTAVIGHDFGSPVAAWCALMRPDVFRSVVMMSAPFGGPPALPFNTADAPAKPAPDDPSSNSQRCRGRASIINGIIQRARRTAT